MPLRRVKSSGRAGRVRVPGPRRAWARPAAWGLAVVVAALIGAGGAFLYKLAHEGIEFGFVRAQLEAALDRRLPPGVEASIGRATLAARWDDGLAVSARDVRFQLPDGSVLAARDVTTTASARALMMGAIDLDLLRIDGVRIVLAGLGPAMQGESRADLLRLAAQALANGVAAVDRQLRAAGLEDLEITDVEIALAGDPAGADAGPPPGARVLEASWMQLGRDRSKIWAQIRSQSRPWTVTLEHMAQASAPARLDVSVADVPVAELWPELADPERRPHYAAPLTLQARIELDDSGAFARMRGRASAGPGDLALSRWDSSIAEGADLELDLPGVGDWLLVRRLALQVGDTALGMAGAVDLAEPGRPLGISLALGLGRLAHARPDGPPIELTSGQFQGRLDPQTQALQIDGLKIEGPAGEVSLAGSIALSGPDAGLALALSIGEMPISMARALWPPMAAPGVRRWFDANVREGIVGPGTLQIALPEIYLGPESRGLVLPDYALTGRLPFRRAFFAPTGRMPDLQDVEAEVSFADATATIVLQSGWVDTQWGALAADGTVLVVPELNRSGQTGDLRLRLTGPAAALAELSDTGPLRIASRQGIVADGLSGHAELSLEVELPLEDARIEDVVEALSPEFRLVLTDFGSEAPIQGRAIADGDLVLEGNLQSYQISGGAHLDGIPASVAIVTGLEDEQSAVRLTLDAAARRQLGLDLGDLVTGVVTASLQESGEEGRRSVVADLGQAWLRLPFAGWEKGAGVPAVARFDMEEGEDGIRISSFALSGEGFAGRGELTLDADGGLRSLRLADVELRPGDNFRLHLERTGEGYALDVSGRALDARGLIEEIKTGGPGGQAGPPIAVSVALDAVTGMNGVTLRNVRGTALVAGGRPSRVALAGASGNGAFEWTVQQNGNAQRLGLRAADAGAMLRALGLYTRISGGALTLDVTGPAGSGDGRGVFQIRRFQVIDERVFADAVAPVGPADESRQALQRAQRREVDGRNMHFSRLEIPFRRQGDLVVIEEAFLRGTVLGGTGSGTINLADGHLAITGTLVPIFGINNILGSIPILGFVLGGGRHEGLVGITYRMLGPIDSPTLQMNPMSAIAPGIFRRIFEYR